MAYVGIFGQDFENNIAINEIIISPIRLIVMFDAKVNLLKYRIKNGLFRYLWNGT